MENIGELLHILVDNLEIKEDNLLLLKKVNAIFPLKEKEFYKVLGYLHDIGKFETLQAISSHKNTNLRIEVYEIFPYVLGMFNIKQKEDLNDNLEGDLSLQDIRPIVIDDDFRKKVKVFFEHVKLFNLKYAIKKNYYFNKLLKLTDLLYPKLIEKLPAVQNSLVINPSYNKELVSKLKSYGVGVDENNIDMFFVTMIFILEEISKFQINEITKPHIIYGLQFFQFHEDFDFLNFVLFHHNYPNQGEIKKHGQDKGLQKLNKILGIKINYFDDDNKEISSSNKNFLMVLLTAVDIIDAKMGLRSYQGKISINKNIHGLLASQFKNTIKETIKLEISQKDDPNPKEKNSGILKRSAK